MDLLLDTDLVELAEPGPVSVSLFVPTHRYGEGVKADRIRWKNLVDAAESALRENGQSAAEAEQLLSPARGLYDDTLEWQHLSDGLAMFLRPDWYRTFRVPATLVQLGAVGDRFVLAPLLRMLSDNEHFLLLAISQSQVRLWEGSRYHLDEVSLPDIPESLRDVVEPAERRTDAMARPADRATRGGPAVFYGHGAYDEQRKQTEVLAFLRQVASGLSGYLAKQRLPMVLAGLEQTLSAFRTVTDYGRILNDEVRRHPDDLSAEELHAAAWPLVEDYLAEGARRLEEAFAATHGTGPATADPDRVSRAAADGRVDTLFLAGDPWCWEQVAVEPPMVVRLGADPDFAYCEQLDRIMVNTVAKSGRILVSPSSTAPAGGDVAALLRY